MREYIVLRPRAAEIDREPDGENYLARTVHETIDLIDVGLLDSEGNKILARKRFDPIGFVRWSER